MCFSVGTCCVCAMGDAPFALYYNRDREQAALEHFTKGLLYKNLGYTDKALVELQKSLKLKQSIKLLEI